MISTRIQEITDDEIRKLCDIVHRQTDYTISQIMDKLIEYDYNHIDIIKDYMGVVVTKPYKIESIQQEIYKSEKTLVVVQVMLLVLNLVVSKH